MEQVVYYIGQALGVLTVVLGFLNYQVKTREQVLAVHIATTLCFGFHFLCIGAWAGMIMNFVGCIRDVVFYFVGKKGKLPMWWIILFAAIMGTMGITASLIAGEAWFFVLSVVGMVINSCAMSFSNPDHIRKSILITSPMVLVYNALSRSYGGTVYESVAIVSSLIGILRFRKKK